MIIEMIPNWHPLFVHFTVALFTLSVIFFAVQRPLADTEIGDNFLVFARYSLWLGVLFSLITLVAGWDAYNTVNHDTPSHLAMTDHRNWGVVTFGVFFIAAIWWLLVQRISEKASLAFLLFLFIGAGLLVTTGHKGSMLVYHYGLGVKSLPAKDDHKAGGGHGHDHAHGHDEMGASPAEAIPTPDDMSMDVETFDEPLLDQSEVAPSATDLKSNAAPKVETFEDGATREMLPEVEINTQ